MVRVVLLVFAAHVVLMALAVISCLSARRSRILPRLLWVPVIILVPLLGPTAWFCTGRPVTRRPGGKTRSAGRRSRPIAPDDDSDFLRSLNEEGTHRDRESFEQWENDLDGRDDPAS